MTTDSIKFGEVVQAPPTLTAKPRKADTKNFLVCIQRTMYLSKPPHGM